MHVECRSAGLERQICDTSGMSSRTASVSELIRSRRCAKPIHATYPSVIPDSERQRADPGSTALHRGWASHAFGSGLRCAALQVFARALRPRFVSGSFNRVAVYQL